MKRLLFMALVCGLAALPSLGAPSLGFWQEGAPGTIHLVWDMAPSLVLEVVPGTSFDTDPSEAIAVPAGVVHTPLGAAIISGTNLTLQQWGLFEPEPNRRPPEDEQLPEPERLQGSLGEGHGSGTIKPTGALATGRSGPVIHLHPLAGPGPGTGADFGWDIRPNPFYEEIEFSVLPGATTGLATLSGIHVDTICVPAPGALLLASLGAAAVGWLRTRRGL